VSPASEYRSLAAALRARAHSEESSELKAEWDRLADCYERLAEQADRNARTDTTYEPILRASVTF
jgi:hypothetical protein